jgi:hypothetical protein
MCKPVRCAMDVPRYEAHQSRYDTNGQHWPPIPFAALSPSLGVVRFSSFGTSYAALLQSVPHGMPPMFK